MRYFITLFLFCFIAHAQEAKPLSTIIPITEQKRPATIPKPYGAPTKWNLLRSCNAPAGENGSLVWLFAFGRKAPVSDRTLVDDLIETAIVVGVPRVDLKGRWRVLRRVSLGLTQKSDAEEFDLRWLHPLQNKGPVLRIYAQIDQKHELIAFPNGWSQNSAVRQTFNDWGNSIQTGSFIFDKADEDGNLLVIESIYNYADGNATKGKDNLWLWNGKGWTDPN